MVIFSEGIGSIQFLSSCGYRLVIHDVLFAPLLTTSLYSTNKFAMEHKGTHFEVLGILRGDEINCYTNSVEFTASIRSK